MNKYTKIIMGTLCASAVVIPTATVLTSCSGVPKHTTGNAPAADYANVSEIVIDTDGKIVPTKDYDVVSPTGPTASPLSTAEMAAYLNGTSGDGNKAVSETAIDISTKNLRDFYVENRSAIQTDFDKGINAFWQIFEYEEDTHLTETEVEIEYTNVNSTPKINNKALEVETTIVYEYEFELDDYSNIDPVKDWDDDDDHDDLANLKSQNMVVDITPTFATAAQVSDSLDAAKRAAIGSGIDVEREDIYKIYRSLMPDSSTQVGQAKESAMLCFQVEILTFDPDTKQLVPLSNNDGSIDKFLVPSYTYNQIFFQVV